MDLVNETPFAARLLGVRRSEEANIQASLIVKATFERDAPTSWVPAKEQVPIIDDRLDTPYGVFHTDCFVRKDGVDVCVLGTIRPATPSRAVQLMVSVGSHSSELTVFGDRRWVRSSGRLAPSVPETFAEMPLGYTHAYGGTTVHDYETAVWADNPVGRGYYLSPEAAAGNPLPNIEATAGPQVRDWSDQPTCAGWGPYPLFWGIRAREGVDPPEKLEPGKVGRIKARLNNNAHPSLVVAKLDGGEEIRIRGMRPQEVVLALPRFSPELEVRLGEQTVTHATSALDGVFVWLDADRVTLTRRIQFDYAYNKGEPRGARLVDALAMKTGA